MKTFLDCVSCLIRQSLDSVRSATDDPAVHEQIMREVLSAASKMDFQQSPPEMAQFIHRRIRELTGQDDPFRAAKDQQNAIARSLYADLQESLRTTDRPLEFAVRLAIAGNIIDLGAKSGLQESEIRNEVTASLSASLDGDLDAFAAAVENAQQILYVTDNAGEIVFDHALIQQLPPDKVTVAVRGAPVINDATFADAQFAGLTDMVQVISNGSDAPGTILEDCSEAFQQRFQQADLIIAKGQGNYETLREAPGQIFFLLRVKCPIIARDLDSPVGRMVLRSNQRKSEAEVTSEIQLRM